VPQSPFVEAVIPAATDLLRETVDLHRSEVQQKAALKRWVNRSVLERAIEAVDEKMNAPRRQAIQNALLDSLWARLKPFPPLPLLQVRPQLPAQGLPLLAPVTPGSRARSTSMGSLKVRPTRTT
jgi:hypothetical protein